MKKQNEGDISRMFAFAGNYHGLTILACILSGLSTILSIIPFACIWFVVRDIIRADSANNSFYAWAAFGFSVASILLYFIALNCSHLAAFRTAKNMKKEALHHIVKLPLGYFEQNSSGKLRKIIDDNAGLTEGFLAHQLPDLIGAVVMPVTIFILLFVFEWRMGICCLIPMAFSIFFMKKMMGSDNAEFMSKYMTALETMNQEAVEYIRGIPVVKVFQQTVYSFKNFHGAIREYKKFAAGYALECRVPLTGFNVSLSGTFVLLIPVALILLQGVSGQEGYIGILLDFLFYILFTPICATMMNRVMFATEQLMAAKSAVSRIEEILIQKPLQESKELQTIEGNSLELKQVSFAYPGTTEKALKDVSFFVPGGSTVALVGASGSGKSTAASLFPRFYDVEEGEVLVGSVDVKNIKKETLMKQVAFVFQNSRMFKASLLDNIRMAKPQASEEEVLAAAEAAQCQEIIERLPGGIHTLVGSGGTYLSGGEAQRIALARAILKDCPIVILDEATAFADAENEHKIQLAFEQLMSQKTVLMIAHRLSTVQNADQILVFAEGKIIERGTHKELLSKQGSYAAMWKDYQSSVSWKVGKEQAHDEIIEKKICTE